tara:strand:+ start:1460 stop:2863 length:1404 start_codon:yes stop_codon:yes gene_type:complete
VRIGTQERPIESPEPMKVAEAVIRHSFHTPNNTRGLWFHQGNYYHWYSNRWVIRNEEWIEDYLWRELEDVFYNDFRDGQQIARRFNPNKTKVDNVVRALKAKIRFQQVHTPAWIPNKPDSPDATECIAFEDVVVDTKTGNTIGRNECWFDHAVVPCDYDKDAKCPTWLRCVKEWGEGDETWAELLQMYMGYCLMNHRRKAKWLLMHGKVRSGKGTIAKVLKTMMGLESFKSTSLDDLSNDFGLDGLQIARVLLISEVSDLDTKAGERAVRVLKQVIGQDPMTINIKHQRQLQNITVNAAPIIQANEIPQLPNKGRGLSSKMLVLPFDVSFEGKEDDRLIDKLLSELPGIASWCIEGAKKVTAGQKFVMPESATETIKIYHLTNNPFDHFLEERFNRNKSGFVASELIWNNWLEWVKDNHIRNLYIPKNQLLSRIQTESSWHLKRHREPQGGKRGLMGLSFRMQFQEV